ncbi:MAG: ATP-binding protein [Bdellovibrionota bacterium]|mgnify:CR=1 FL=1
MPEKDGLQVRALKAKAPKRVAKRAEKGESGQLKIGNQWSAITIIALSQSNPLKAIAEFVENSIDAKAKRITIYRGKEAGAHYLRIHDDGNGIPLNEEGLPDFKFVATHICDSIKRRMKADGALGIQGEFGIGLLSFWTVGEQLTLRSAGRDGKSYQMSMRKNESRFSVRRCRTLFAQTGTELEISPLLAGLRQFSGEKLQWYLASELRNRILEAGVEIKIVNRNAKAEYRVEPRKFTGRRLQIAESPDLRALGLRAELYIDTPKPENRVALCRQGTRVLESISDLDEGLSKIWTSGYLQGLVDCPNLSLTPGTRLGIVRDASYSDFCVALASIQIQLESEVAQQLSAEEARASKNTLFSLQRAFKEALQALPQEEYDWFDLREKKSSKWLKSGTGTSQESSEVGSADAMHSGSDGDRAADPAPLQQQRAFFDFPGPLFSARISPASTLVPVLASRALKVVARDRKGQAVRDGLCYTWTLLEGGGTLANTEGEILEFTAPAEPGLTRISVKAKQGQIECEAIAVITVTATLSEAKKEDGPIGRGLPGYTFQRAPGESWRSRYDEARNLVLINNGQRDFVFAARSNPLKLRYLCRLFTKELVQRNFPGASPSELLERMIEVGLYAEENLK